MGPMAGLDGCGKSRPPTGIRSPDSPARSEYRSKFGIRFHGVSIPSGVNVQEVFVLSVSTVCNWLCGSVYSVELILRMVQTSQQVMADLGGIACCQCDRNDRTHFFGYSEFGRI